MFFPTDILRAALHCVAGKNETREYLKGVYITPKHIKATDGRALVMMEHGADTDIDGVFRVIGDIPAEAEGTLIKTINAQWVAIHVNKDEKAVGHSLLELIEGKYPDFNKLLPDEPEPYSGMPTFAADLLALPHLMFDGYAPVKFKPYGKARPCVVILDAVTNRFYGNPLLVIMPMLDNAFELYVEALNEKGI